MTVKKKFGQNMIFNNGLIILIIASCFFGSSFLKLDGFNNFSPVAKTGEFYFSTENAFQFYLAKKLATTGKIEGFEKRLQYPEGFDVNRNILLLMEMTCAFIYRLFSIDLPFHRYVFIFVSFFSSLSIIAVFLIVLVASKNTVGAISTAVVLSFSLGTWARTIGSFAREDFTLPLLTFFLLGLLLVLADKKIFFASGLTFAMAFLSLISWHLTSFFMFLVLMIIFIVLIFGEEFNKITNIFLSTGCACLLAGLISSPLRTKGFLLGPMSLFIVVVIISLVLKKWWWRSKITGLSLVIIIWLGSILLGNFLLPSHWTEYGHVYNLILAKIRFLGIKPENPLQLADEARFFWIGPYDSPSWPVMVDYFILPLFLGVPTGLYLLIFRRNHSSVILILLAAVWVGITLLMARFIIFGILFLYIVFGIWAGEIFRSVRNRLVRLFVLVLTIGVGIGGFLRLAQRPIRDDLIDEEIYLALKYLTEQGEPGEPVLTTFGRSASIIAYTNKASTLHPMFENESIRKKNLEITKGFYGSMEEFQKIIEKYQVRYCWYLQNEILFITGKSSLRYMAGLTRVLKRSPAYLMSFKPEAIPFLEVVYQTSQHRIFKVLKPNETARKVYPDYSFFFDEKNFETADTTVSGDFLQEKKRIIFESYHITRKALEVERNQETVRAEALLKEAIRLFPRNIMALNNLGSLYHNQGRDREARSYLETVLAIHPSSVEAVFNLGLVHRALNNRADAIYYFEKACQLAPELDEANVYLSRCLIEVGRRQEATRMLQKLLDRSPDNFEAQQLLKEITQK